MSKLLKYVALLFLGLCLTNCGIKGNLDLPDEPEVEIYDK